jgi:hypothetical protein
MRPIMEVVVTLKPEWYDKLVASARPQSKAEACLQSATNRRMPDGTESEYVLRCDEQTIAVIAALADVVCPEAIPTMLTAYTRAKQTG